MQTDASRSTPSPLSIRNDAHPALPAAPSRQPRVTSAGAQLPPQARQARPGARTQGSTAAPAPPLSGQPALTQSAAALQDRRRAAYPQFETVVMRDFVDQIQSATGITVDPEQTYLDEFSAGQFQDGRWRFSGKPVRSTSLADLARRGFPNDIDWLHIEMNARAAVVHRGPAAATGTAASSRLAIDVAHLKNIVDGIGSPSRSYLTQLNKFWGNDDPVHPGLQLQSLLNSAHAYQSARTQHEAGQLSATAMAMIRQAAGFPQGAPLSMNSYALDIGGYLADDIVVLQAAGGRTVLVQPGAAHPFQEFERAADLRVAIKDLVVDPQARARLASHFSLDDRRDSFKAGVDSLLEMLAQEGNRAGVPILADRARIGGDVFDWMARGQRRSRMAEAITLLSNDVTDAAARHYLDSRGRQLFQAPTDLFATRHAQHGRSGEDAWRDALEAAMNGGASAAWVRRSELKPPALTGLRAAPPELQRNIAQRSFALADAEQTLAAHELDLQREAADFMARKLHQAFGFTHPIAKYALVSYHDDFVKPAVGGGGMPHMPPQRIPHPLAGRVREIVPLSEIAVSNLPYVGLHDEGSDPAKVHARSAVVKIDAIPKRWDEVTRSELPVQALVALVRDKTRFDFESEVLKSVDLFYQTHGGSQSSLAAQRALLVADFMQAEGTLSATDHALAVAGFGLAPAATAQQAGARPRVCTYAVNLNGYVSHNAMRITDHATGRTLLYFPENREPIKAFASTSDATNWLLRVRKEPQATQRFVADHFSAGNAQQVSALLDYRRRFSPTFRSSVLTDAVDITDNPFRQLQGIEHRQLRADLEDHVCSSDDIGTNRWLQALEATPLPYVPAIAKSIAGPTAEQRRQGLKALGMEVLMDIFMLGAGTAGSAGFKGLKRLWKTVRRDASDVAGGAERAARNGVARWFKPPQRVDGKIGYPLSPNVANQAQMIRTDIMASASKYDVVNPEIRRTGNPYYHWDALGPASRALFRQKNAQLHQDGLAFFKHNPVPARPKPAHPDIRQEWLDGRSPHPYPPPNPEFNRAVMHKALTSKDGLLSNGLIFGENHKSDATRKAIIARLDEFDSRGVKTIYLEALLRDDSPSELRHFNLTGDMSRKLRDQLTKGNGDERMIELMMRAHDKGMKIVALDSLAAWPAPGTRYDGAVRMTTMNYAALNIIRAEQMSNGFKPYIALVGQHHAKRSYGVPGINEATGAPSVFAGYALSPYGMPLNGLDFSLAVPFAST